MDHSAGHGRVADGPGEAAIADTLELAIPAGDRQPHFELDLGVVRWLQHSSDAAEGRQALDGLATGVKGPGGTAWVVVIVALRSASLARSSQLAPAAASTGEAMQTKRLMVVKRDLTVTYTSIQKDPHPCGGSQTDPW